MWVERKCEGVGRRWALGNTTRSRMLWRIGGVENRLGNELCVVEWVCLCKGAQICDKLFLWLLVLVKVVIFTCVVKVEMINHTPNKTKAGVLLVVL